MSRWRRSSAYERYTELVQLRADLRDLALVLGRGADDDGPRHALDDVVDAFGRARRGLSVAAVALHRSGARRPPPGRTGDGRAAARAVCGVLEQEPDAGAPLLDRAHRVPGARRARRRRPRRLQRRRGDTVTVHEVWIDGVRSDGEAYAEALERVRAADPSDRSRSPDPCSDSPASPGVRPVPSERLRAPVPDWLADALVREAGLTRLAVAAMDATTAFDVWNSREVPRRAPTLRRAERRSADYLRSTVAPASSSCALAFSASSLVTFSSTGFGAPSTRSLASFRPRPDDDRPDLLDDLDLLVAGGARG